jgi:hypothetical protein
VEAAELSAAGLCPRCDAPRTADQRYCIDCGLRLPLARGPIAGFRRFWVRRLGWYPGDWALPAFAALLVAAAGAAAAVRLAHDGGDGGSTFAATTPPAAAARAGAARKTTPDRALQPANVLIEWPQGVSGWTVVLVSVPRAAGETAARAKAARAAKSGLPEAGVLVSDRFASLHPGYFVIFTGVYGSEAEAEAAVPTARSRGFGGAYVRPVVS